MICKFLRWCTAAISVLSVTPLVLIHLVMSEYKSILFCDFFFSIRNAVHLQIYSLLCMYIYVYTVCVQYIARIYSSGEKANEESIPWSEQSQDFICSLHAAVILIILHLLLYRMACTWGIVSSNFLANNEQVPSGLLALSCAHFFGVNYLFY